MYLDINTLIKVASISSNPPDLGGSILQGKSLGLERAKTEVMAGLLPSLLSGRWWIIGPGTRTKKQHADD